MSRLKEVIAFVNYKGGVGKTSTVQNVAAAIVRRDRNARVLVIDLDPSGNLSTVMGWNDLRTTLAEKQQNYHTIADAMTTQGGGVVPVFQHADRWYYAPSSPNLAQVENALPSLSAKQFALADCLDKGFCDYSGTITDTQDVEEAFDYILIDCLPAVGHFITLNAFVCADSVVIPMTPDEFSLEGVQPLINDITFARSRHMNPRLVLRGFLFTRCDVRQTMTKTYVAAMREKYPDQTFTNSIRECCDVKKAQAEHTDVLTFSPKCNAAIDYIDFTEELLGDA